MELISVAYMRARAAVFASTVALALVFASTLAAANGLDADRDGVSDGVEDATERTVAATSSGDGFSASSHLGSGSVADQFELSYQAGTFDVWYDQTGGTSSFYTLELRNLTEWTDGNGDDTIDEGEVVGRTALGSSAFGGVTVNRSNRMDADGGRVTNFDIPSRSGNITLHLTIAQRFMRLGDATLTPMEAKMEIRMNPVVNHPGASLGLEFRLNTPDPVIFEDRGLSTISGAGPIERSMKVTSGEGGQSAEVFFSWTKTALADGSTIPVALSNRSVGAGSYDFYLSYPLDVPRSRPMIVHQVSFGVHSVVHDIFESAMPEVSGDLALYTGTFAAMSGLLAATTVLANGRRRKGGDENRKP